MASTAFSGSFLWQLRWLGRATSFWQSWRNTENQLILRQTDIQNADGTFSPGARDIAAKQNEESGSDSSDESNGEATEEGFLSTSNEEFEEIILTDQGNISIQAMKEQSVYQNDSDSESKSQHSAPTVEAYKKPCLFFPSSTIETVREEVSNFHLLLLQICKNEFSKQMPNDDK